MLSENIKQLATADKVFDNASTDYIFAVDKILD